MHTGSVPACAVLLVVVWSCACNAYSTVGRGIANIYDLK